MAHATAAVVWLHGLGDTSAGWSSLTGQYRSALPHVKWVLPDAPKQPVTCNGGMRMTSWFDIFDIPVDEREPDSPPGLQESVQTVHRLVEDLIAGGIPAHRIVLGGFSQGSAIAQHSGYTCKHKLAGIVGFSGWGMQRKQIGALLSAGANQDTPTLLCHGTRDAVVAVALGRISFQNLLAQGKTNVELKEYPMAHESSPAEMRDLGEFLARVLPP